MVKQGSLKEKLEDIRVNLGLTHSALAKQIGITWKTYEKFRKGDSLTRKATEQKIRSFTERPTAVKSAKRTAPKAKRQSKSGEGISSTELEFVLQVMTATNQERLSLTQIRDLAALKK